MPPSSRPTDERSPCDAAPHNRLGFAYQVAFVRVLGRFPQQAPLEIDGEILRFRGHAVWGPTPRRSTSTPAGSRRSPEHQQRIGEYLRLHTVGHRRRRTAGAVPRGRGVAARADRLAGWRGRAPGSATSTFSRRPIRCCAARSGLPGTRPGRLLTERMAERLSAPMRDRLDALIAVDDDQPHSPLNRIKGAGARRTRRAT